MVRGGVKAEKIMKPLKGIIDRMKEKAGGSPSEIQADEPPIEDEVNVDDIPF